MEPTPAIGSIGREQAGGPCAAKTWVGILKPYHTSQHPQQAALATEGRGAALYKAMPGVAAMTLKGELRFLKIYTCIIHTPPHTYV